VPPAQVVPPQAPVAPMQPQAPVAPMQPQAPVAPMQPQAPAVATDDLFGRGKVHPSQIPRFSKYFPSQGQGTFLSPLKAREQ
jgi:hypothetical protein